ncbi:hypothetical protein M0805_007898 [Coniferiporia weirii]|nr:hypothetical protein M0805_007898 [Coniferiporia weirii]
MLAKLLATSAFLPLVWAFSNTVPLVAWSNHKNTLVDPFPELGQHGVDAILSGDQLCSFNIVVLIDQPGLHAQDLRTLSPSSAIPLRLKTAQKSLQLPYVRQDASSMLSEAIRALALRCDSKIHQVGAESEFELDESDKHALYLTLPPVSGEGAWRGHIMNKIGNPLARAIDQIESVSQNAVFIYTGSGMPGLDRRQTGEGDTDAPFSFAAVNGTSSSGILHKYQLLTPGLIVSLLVTFFVLVPIIMFSVQALTSIQSSVRLDTPKGPSQDKKKQ